MKTSVVHLKIKNLKKYNKKLSKILKLIKELNEIKLELKKKD